MILGFSFADFFGDFFNEFRKFFRTQVSLTAFSYCHQVCFSFFFANHKKVGDFLNFGSNPVFLKLFKNLITIASLLVANWQNRHLNWRKPRREFAGEVLEEKSDHSFMTPKRRPVDNNRTLLGAFLVDEGEVKAIGHKQIYLDRADGIFFADDRLNNDISFWSVVSRAAHVFSEFYP